MNEGLRHLFEAFNNLNEREKTQFTELVFNQMTSEMRLDSLQNEAGKNKRKQCPHCQSPSIFANGKLNNMQRYKCKGCLKNFSESTGTALASIKKKDLWLNYIRYMFEGKSLVKCAELVGISKQTSFDWRHKILSRLRHEAPEKFSGICELDDIFFNYSEKGSRTLNRKPRKRGNHGISQGTSDDKVAVLLTQDRSNRKDIQVIKRGRIRKADLKGAIGERLDSNTVLCSDSHRSFTGFARENNYTLKKINARKGQHIVDKVYHIQHVNQMSQAIKKWMQQFNGVASKYLQNYMNWFMIMEKIKSNSAKIKAFTIAILAAPANAQILKSYVI